MRNENIKGFFKQNYLIDDVFIGWDKSVGDKITSDTTITAKWKVTITYSSSYGRVPESKTVDMGYKLTDEDLPFMSKKSGKLFGSWDKNPGDEITQNTKITANWNGAYVELGKMFEITFAGNKDCKSVDAIKFQKEAYTGTDGVKFGTNDSYTAFINENNELVVSGNGNYVYINDLSAIKGKYDIKSISFKGCNTTDLTNLKEIFAGTEEGDDNSWFTGNYNLKVPNEKLISVDFSGCDLSNVTSMSKMCYACTNLTSINFTGCNASNPSMERMFDACFKLISVDFSSFHACVFSSMEKKCSEVAVLLKI